MLCVVHVDTKWACAGVYIATIVIPYLICSDISIFSGWAYINFVSAN